MYDNRSISPITSAHRAVLSDHMLKAGEETTEFLFRLILALWSDEDSIGGEMKPKRRLSINKEHECG